MDDKLKEFLKDYTPEKGISPEVDKEKKEQPVLQEEEIKEEEVKTEEIKQEGQDVFDKYIDELLKPSQEEKKEEASTTVEGGEAVEEIKLKVYGKDVIVKWDRKTGKAIVEEEGRPPREFESISELLQKGLASDEKFQYASLLKKQAEEKLKMLETQRKILADELLQITNGNPDEIDDEMIKEQIRKIKERDEMLKQELARTKVELLQYKANEYLSHPVITEFNKASDKNVGSLMFAGLTMAILETLKAQGRNIEDPSVIEEAWKTAIDWIDEAYKKLPKTLEITKDTIPTVISKLESEYPDVIRQIEERAIKKFVQELKKRKVLPASSSVATEITETLPQQPEKVGKDFLLNLLKQKGG